MFLVPVVQFPNPSWDLTQAWLLIISQKCSLLDHLLITGYDIHYSQTLYFKPHSILQSPFQTHLFKQTKFYLSLKWEQAFLNSKCTCYNCQHLIYSTAELFFFLSNPFSTVAGISLVGYQHICFINHFTINIKIISRYHLSNFRKQNLTNTLHVIRH